MATRFKEAVLSDLAAIRKQMKYIVDDVEAISDHLLELTEKIDRALAAADRENGS